MGSKTAEEWVKDLQTAEDTGDTERAEKIRAGLEAAGIEIPRAQGAPEPTQGPEPSFLDNWGRVIAEGGGALVGGAMGAPGGIPGIMAGAALGGHGAGMGWDWLAGDEAPPPGQQILNAGFNATGGPLPAPPAQHVSKTFQNMLSDPDALALNLADNVVRDRSGGATALSVGQRRGGAAAQMEAAVESTPFGVGTIDKQRQGVRNIFNELIDEATPGTSSRETVGSGIGDQFRNQETRARQQVDWAYGQVDELLHGDTDIPMSNLQKALSKYDQLIASDGEFAELAMQDADLRKAFEAMRSAVDSGNLPSYETIKQFRTIVGRKADNAFGAQGVKDNLKYLYKILSQDLDEGIRHIAGDEGVAARGRADALNRTLMSELDQLEPIMRHMDNPSRLYDAMDTALRNNPNLFAKVKQVVHPNQWDRFVETWINRAATPTPGKVSMVEGYSENTLMTNLNRLKQQSPEGYKVLTEGKEDALNVIGALAEAMQRGNQYINHSRTASAVGQQKLASELLFGGVPLAIGAGTGNINMGMIAGGVAATLNAVIPKLTAKALTSPSITAALNKIGRTGRTIPTGADLFRALIAAGANEAEVQEIFRDEENPVPMQEAGNAVPF